MCDKKSTTKVKHIATARGRSVDPKDEAKYLENLAIASQMKLGISPK
jgi:hypothetical protein